MQLHDLDSQRVQLALDVFSARESIEFVNISLRLLAAGSIEVAVKSSWSPENVSAATAKSDLEAGRSSLESLRRGAPAVRALLDSSELRFVLVHDYGNGAIELCVEQGQDLRWSPGFAPASW